MLLSSSNYFVLKQNQIVAFNTLYVGIELSFYIVICSYVSLLCTQLDTESTPVLRTETVLFTVKVDTESTPVLRTETTVYCLGCY